MSDLMNEDNVHALNDIYNQNEFNLESFLHKIQEKNESSENESKEKKSELQEKIDEKRLELKYISSEKEDTFASERSLRDLKLSINKSRVSKNEGKRRAILKKRVEEEGDIEQTFE